MDLQTFFFLATCSLAIYGSPISTEYGVPKNIPFETYGLPTLHSDDFILDQPRTLPVVKVQKLSPDDENQELLPVVAPPNSHIQLRDGRNQYSVGFQDQDGTEVKEQGRLISTDNGWEYVIAKTGSYKYISPEGTEVAVEWIADEKGFRILSSTV